jgi:hypothetical protein
MGGGRESGKGVDGSGRRWVAGVQRAVWCNVTALPLIGHRDAAIRRQ